MLKFKTQIVMVFFFYFISVLYILEYKHYYIVYYACICIIIFYVDILYIDKKKNANDNSFTGHLISPETYICCLTHIVFLINFCWLLFACVFFLYLWV